MKPTIKKQQIEFMRRKGELLRQTAILLNAIEKGEIVGLTSTIKIPIGQNQDTRFEITDFDDICLNFMGFSLGFERPIARQPKPEKEGGVCELYFDMGWGNDVMVISESNPNEIDPNLNETIAEILKNQD